MPRRIRSSVLVSTLFGSLAAIGGAAGQTPPPSLFDPSQLPTVHGIVTHYTLVPNGSVDGFILQDGNQVLVVPLFSAELLSNVHLGDAVTVYGLKATGKKLFMAMAILNDKSDHSVLLGEIPLMLAMGRAPHHDQGPSGSETLPAAAKPTAQKGNSVKRHGVVERPIYGPLGNVSGALLTDGVTLRVASTESARVAPLFKPGNTVWASGEISESGVGKLILVQAIGQSETALTELAPWDGPK